MKHHAILLAILALTLIIGCKKERTEITYYTTYVNKAMLVKYFFRPGTYWVYENQNNLTDSVIVTGEANGFTTIPCPHGCPDGIITRDEFYKMNLLDVTNNVASNYYYTSDYLRLNGGGEYNQDGQPVFMFDRPVNYSFNGASIVEKYDSLTIADIKYYDVIKMKITANQQYQHEFEFDTYLWFADNFGLVKKEVNNTIQGFQTWNLMRVQIVK